MAIELSWRRRDAETRKQMNVEFTLVRENATWIIQRARYEKREPYIPDQQDWDTLFEMLDRHLARNKVSPSDVATVKKLHEKWEERH